MLKYRLRIEPNLHPYSSVFHDLSKELSTGLCEYYRKNQIVTVIIGGLALDYCVKETAIDLYNLGFRVIVNLKATRAIGDEISTITDLTDRGIIVIRSLDELIMI